MKPIKSQYASEFDVKVVMEAFDDNLRNIVRQRISRNVYLEEGHITRIINVVAKCLAELKDENLSHLNINPETIVLSNGRFKLNHPMILNPFTNNESNYRNNLKSYASPEQLTT